VGLVLIALSTVSLLAAGTSISGGLSAGWRVLIMSVGDFFASFPAAMVGGPPALDGDRVVSWLRVSMSLKAWGILIPTVLITLLGADFQQFLLEARSGRIATFACGLAAVMLLLVGFLPTAVVLSAKGNSTLGPSTTFPTALPDAFLSLGTPGSLYGLIMVATAMGSAAAVIVGMVKAAPFRPWGSITDDEAPEVNVRLAITTAFIYVCGSLGMAMLMGQAIVGILTSFYVFYVAGVFLPFCLSWRAWLTNSSSGLMLTATRTLAAVGTGTASAVFFFFLLRANGYEEVQSTLPSLLIGVGASAIALGGIALLDIVRNRMLLSRKDKAQL